MIAIIAPVRFESDYLESCLSGARTITLKSREVRIGKINRTKVMIVNSGMGKVNAAHTTTLILENFKVSQVILTGIGGAYPNSGLKRGDVAIATMELYGDEGVIGDEWHDLRKIGIPLLIHKRKNFFNEFPLDAKILTRLRRIETDGFHIKKGIFVTVSSCSGTEEVALKRERMFRAICENMEGAAVAHTCMMYEIPMIEVRGVSNYAGVRDRRRWNIKIASINAQKSVIRILDLL